VLQQVVGKLDTLPDEQKQRWEQLLWFAHALVYHSREADERDQCAEYIRATVSAARQVEVSGMSQTRAESLQVETKRATLLRLLRRKFDSVPVAIEATIQATQDGERLDAWLDAFATARKLSDIPFEAGV
jgi:hypothetical protein